MDSSLRILLLVSIGLLGDEKKDKKWTPNEEDALDHFMKQAQNYLEKVSSDLPDLSKRQFSDVVLLGKLAERPSTER